jgi:hypothetical protein
LRADLAPFRRAADERKGGAVLIAVLYQAMRKIEEKPEGVD